MKKFTNADYAYEAIARNLREFGYADVTAEMVREVHAAVKRGDSILPHGVVGMFAKDQLESDEAAEIFAKDQP